MNLVLHQVPIAVRSRGQAEVGCTMTGQGCSASVDWDGIVAEVFRCAGVLIDLL